MTPILKHPLLLLGRIDLLVGLVNGGFGGPGALPTPAAGRGGCAYASIKAPTGGTEKGKVVYRVVRNAVKSRWGKARAGLPWERGHGYPRPARGLGPRCRRAWALSRPRGDPWCGTGRQEYCCARCGADQDCAGQPQQPARATARTKARKVAAQRRVARAVKSRGYRAGTQAISSPDVLGMSQFNGPGHEPGRGKPCYIQAVFGVCYRMCPAKAWA